MEIFLAFAPPFLAAVVTFLLTRHSQKSDWHRNFTTEFKITFSRHYRDDDQT